MKKESDIQESFIEAADKRINIAKEEKWNSTLRIVPLLIMMYQTGTI